MKRLLSPAVAALFLFAAAAPARADLAPPKPPPAPGQSAKLVVEVDPNAKEPRLVVPVALLGATPKDGPKDKETAFLGLGLPTIVVGLALSLAFVSGGFWLVRRGRGRTAAAVVLALALLTAAATAVWADVPIGPRPKPKNDPVALPAGVTLSDKITVVADNAAAADAPVRLIITKDMLIPGKDKTDEKKDKE
jgi:hypothetical protein